MERSDFCSSPWSSLPAFIIKFFRKRVFYGELMERLITITAAEQPATSPGNPPGRRSEERASLVRRGRRLEYFTIAWNSLEGLVAILSGLIAGSIALVGFGLDSLIEVTSGAALLWRLNIDVNEEKRERIEAIMLRIVGVCFIALAIYVSYDRDRKQFVLRQFHVGGFINQYARDRAGEQR